MRVLSFLLGMWSAILITVFIDSVKEGDTVGIYIFVVVIIITTLLTYLTLKGTE